MPEQQLLFSFNAPQAAPAPETADAAARLAALDPTRSFIAQAPAGSGKTELLIQRYLRLLARVDAPESVVAVTFTIKAAAEMRERVMRAFEAAGGPESERPHERLTWTLARAVLEQDARQGWALAETPSRMRIQTIDALSMSIVRQMPWTARMGAMPDVTEDARRLYLQAAESTIRHLDSNAPIGGAIETLLRHLDFNASSARNLLARMLEIRDHWLPIVGGELDPDLPKVRARLELQLGAIASRGIGELCASLATDEAAELIALGKLQVLPLDTGGWRELAKSLLLTSGDDLRKKAPKGFAAKDRLERLLIRLHANGPFKAAIEDLRKLPDAVYSHEQWEVLAALFTVLPRAVAELRVSFAERETVDFAEISQAALRALGTLENPTDLALTLGNRIEHLLVDEFQDTSRTQEKLLGLLTAGWDEGDGRTLFLVGDPMQSVYRFRQADVGIFLSIRERGLASLHPEPVTLSSNFRSAPPIVEWVNSTFRTAFPGNENALLGAVPYSVSEAVRQRAGSEAVFVHPLPARDDSAESAQIVELIEQARERKEKVAVLVRARTHLLETAAMLRDRGIPFRAVEIDSLAERPVVQDLLALTRALLHLADRPAWLAILRAPWCGLTLASLEAIARDRSRTLWDCLQSALDLDAGDAPRLAAFRSVIAPALDQRGRIPLRRLVEGAWVALSGPACLLNESSLNDANAFFDLLERESAGGDLPDAVEFLGKIAELYAAPDPLAPDTLELMTIHKAKGLEFDRVIVPGLGRGIKPDEAKLLLWSDREGGEVLLAPISARHQDTHPTCRFLIAEERTRGEYETVRLLYVACTRARNALHLIGHVEKGKPESGSFLQILWPSVQDRFVELSEIPAAAPAPAIPPPLRRLPAEWAGLTLVAADGPNANPVGVAIPTASATPNHIGEIIHRFLERIATEGVELWNEDRLRAARGQIEFALTALGVPHAEVRSASAAVHQSLLATLTNERGRWILGAHDDARNEFELTAVVDGAVVHVRIDRTFVDESGSRWIIDFKTSSPLDADEHWPQLERYASVLREFEARPVHICLYFPASAAWIDRMWDNSSKCFGSPSSLL